MEELLASQTRKFTTVSRGQQVEGEIISITEKEIILDLGAKSEGVLQKRESDLSQIKDLKVGDKLKTYVALPENEYGQVILSSHYQTRQPKGLMGKGKGGNWSKFIQAQSQKSRLQATVIEVNKGGLIVEVEGVRGFLPNSQVGFEVLSKAGQGLEKLIGKSLILTVIEVDPSSNKLIFTQRGQVSDQVITQLKAFKIGQKVSGKIIAILPFGAVVDIAGIEGLVFISDVSWEKIEDLSKQFTIGQNIEVVVIGIDESLGRLNLSLKQLSEDPFAKLAEKYGSDEVVKAEVISVTEAGVSFKLEKGMEGLLPASKMESGAAYVIGKSMNVLVDSVDVQRRRINLAPFVTSTAGLIYK